MSDYSTDMIDLDSYSISDLIIYYNFDYVGHVDRLELSIVFQEALEPCWSKPEGCRIPNLDKSAGIFTLKKGERDDTVFSCLQVQFNVVTKFLQPP